MIDFSNARINKLAVGFVGNKNRYEGVSIPDNPCLVPDAFVEELLIGLFSNTFAKSSEFFYSVNDPDNIEEPNRAYQSVTDLFSNPDDVARNYASLSVALYDCMQIPKAQGGEFIVTLFEDLLYDGNPVNAIGLWKVDSKEPVFQLAKSADGKQIVDVKAGYQIQDKIEVGALILNINGSEGYEIATLDKISKRDERSFWSDDFLRLRPVEDHYFQTKHLMSCVSEFITGHLAHKNGVGQVGVAQALIRARDYMVDYPEFAVDDFCEQVFSFLSGEEPIKATEEFLTFREQYYTAYAIPKEDYFTISTEARKKHAKLFRINWSIDGNMNLTIKDHPEYIQFETDEDGQRFLRIPFTNIEAK